MGVMVQATCVACGFRSETLMLGPAPHPNEFDPALTSCAKCHKLVVVNRPEMKAGCPDCRGRLRNEEKAKVACPLCKKTLSFENDGLWD